MAYHPGVNSLFVPYTDNCLDMTAAAPASDGKPAVAERRDGIPRPGSKPEEFAGLAKINVATGEIQHIYKGRAPGQGAVLATGGRPRLLGGSGSEVQGLRRRERRDGLGDDARRNDSEQHDHVRGERKAIHRGADGRRTADGRTHRRKRNCSRRAATTRCTSSRCRDSRRAHDELLLPGPADGPAGRFHARGPARGARRHRPDDRRVLDAGYLAESSGDASQRARCSGETAAEGRRAWAAGHFHSRGLWRNGAGPRVGHGGRRGPGSRCLVLRDPGRSGRDWRVADRFLRQRRPEAKVSASPRCRRA